MRTIEELKKQVPKNKYGKYCIDKMNTEEFDTMEYESLCDCGRVKCEIEQNTLN